MATTKVIKTVFQFRRAKTTEWELNKSIIPAAGEPCFDLDLSTLRIGNGVDTYENLKPIGGVKVDIATDGSSIVMQDNVLKLSGFDAAEIGAQPRKNAEGKLEWVVPSTETVEGLQAAVAGLQSDVTSLQTTVINIQEIVNPSAEGAVPLLDRLESLEAKVDGTGEDSIEAKVEAKVDSKIEAFASTLTPDDGKVNTLLEVINYVEEHGQETLNMANEITDLRSLVGEVSVADQIANAGHITKAEVEDTMLSKVEAAAVLKHVKYEISSKPVGTLVDYRDKEIRIMVPADADFKHQSSGANADKNAYYIGFKAYAPAGAVSFKEDLAEIISDNTMHTFEGNDFAGIDAYGRKYSICWLAVAHYDEATQKWSRYGDASSKAKYIGWYYSVEWYDANGKKIESDCIRINLSNEDCHNNIEPYYMSNVVKEVSVNGTLLDIVDGKVDINVNVGIKSSDEIEVAEDGTLKIKSISFDKIAQSEDEVIVMDGGSAVN